jgi:SEC-C motif-containing protein
MPNKICHCGLIKSFQYCCEPIINGIQKATTAEALMRSRYSAYATHKVDYIFATTHVTQRKFNTREEVLNWATSNQWQKLEVMEVTEFKVQFKAFYRDDQNENCIHHELSNFIFENGTWYYVDGEFY